MMIDLCQVVVEIDGVPFVCGAAAPAIFKSVDGKFEARMCSAHAALVEGTCDTMIDISPISIEVDK